MKEQKEQIVDTIDIQNGGDLIHLFYPGETDIILEVLRKSIELNSSIGKRVSKRKSLPKIPRKGMFQYAIYTVLDKKEENARYTNFDDILTRYLRYIVSLCFDDKPLAFCVAMSCFFYEMSPSEVVRVFDGIMEGDRDNSDNIRRKKKDILEKLKQKFPNIKTVKRNKQQDIERRTPSPDEMEKVLKTLEILKPWWLELSPFVEDEKFIDAFHEKSIWQKYCILLSIEGWEKMIRGYNCKAEKKIKKQQIKVPNTSENPNNNRYSRKKFDETFISELMTFSSDHQKRRNNFSTFSTVSIDLYVDYKKQDISCFEIGLNSLIEIYGRDKKGKFLLGTFPLKIFDLENPFSETQQFFIELKEQKLVLTINPFSEKNQKSTGKIEIKPYKKDVYTYSKKFLLELHQNYLCIKKALRNNVSSNFWYICMSIIFFVFVALVLTVDKTKDFSQADLSNGMFESILAIDDYQGLDVVDLKNSNVTNKKMVKIAEITKVKSLDLSYNPITDYGLSLIKDLSYLQILDLSNTKISNEGLKILANFTKLNKLNISSNYSINDDGVAHIKNLHKIKHLNINSTSVTDKFVWTLKELKEISFLSLRDTKITSKLLDNAPSLKNLYHLDLGETKINDMALKNIKKFSKLSVLTLSNTKVSSNGIKYVAEHPNLSVIHLRQTNVDDRCVEYLKKIKNLRYVNLEQTDVSSEAVNDLKNYFRDLIIVTERRDMGSLTGIDKKISELHNHLVKMIMESDPTDTGVEKASKTASFASEIDLSDTKITEVGLKFLDSFNYLSTLTLDSTNVNNQGLKEIAKLKGLKYLSFRGAKLEDKCEVGIIAQMKNLVHLNLGETSIKDEDIKSITNLSNLEVLVLSNTHVSNSAINYLRNTNLSILHLRNTNINDLAINDISTMKNLCYINLVGTKITQQGLVKLNSLLEKTMILPQLDNRSVSIFDPLEPNANSFKLANK